ncbi:protein Caf130p [Monosporozyma unispora]|nr:hypothetical protein C6P44_004243 [Kazachstania unispora]
MSKRIDEFTLLRQRVPGYKSTLRSLRYQIGQEINNPTGNLDSLFIEATSVVLFTTRIGLSILNELYKLKQNLIPKDKILNNSEVKFIHSKWDKTTFLKFCQFCLSNDLLIFDEQWYNNSLYKQNLFNIIMGPKWNQSLTVSSLGCDSNYNILLDLLTFFQKDIELALNDMTTHYITDAKWDKDGHVPKSMTQFHTIIAFVVGQYDRTYSSCNYFIKFDVQLKEELPKPKLLSKNKLILCYLKSVANSDIWDALFLNAEPKVKAVTNFHDMEEKDESKEYLSILKKRYNNQHQKQYHEQQSHPINAPLNDKNSNTMIDINWNSNVRYGILALILNLNSYQDFMCTTEQFQNLCSLVDPLTQPLPNDNYVVSIDLLADLFLQYCYNDIKPGKIRYQGFDIKFHVGMNMERIIMNSMERFNCSSYDRLQNIGLNCFNDKNIENLWDYMYGWLPRGLNTQDLEVLYMVNIMAVYVIYKLYNDKPIQLNPFLSILISVWKKLSCVILFSLDVDRMLEQDETRETPLLIRATIRGSSALRAVIATVLNNQVEYMEHDFKHEPVNTFMSPHGRKLCQGALHADLRSHAAAMLALGVDLKDVTDLLADLQAGDRFDEDIRYMFEYEYEDYNVVDNEPSTGKPNANVNDEKTGGLFQYRRCDCIFDDDKMVSIHNQKSQDNLATTTTPIEANHNGNSNISNTNTPFAIRSKAFFEFDYSGKDWRDVPRGLNLYYTPTYKFVKNPKLEDVNKLMVRATTTFFTHSEAVLLLRLVASCVKEEQESMILNRFTENGKDNATQQGENKAKIVTPDDIYEIWCDSSAFEKMVYLNLELAWKLMDEMLMCNGYRRVLIWFLTHMELNHTLIHYIFELVMGLRGQEFDPTSTLEDKKKTLLHDLLVTKKTDDDDVKSESKDESKDKLPFSRQGPLILSEIETNMLLQEFFTNAAIFLSNSNPDNDEDVGVNGTNNDENGKDSSKHVSLYTIGLVKLICFMVRTLMENEKFDFTKAECSFELQTLLMNWIGLIPEAQELFFMIKSSIADNTTSDSEDEEKSKNYIITRSQIQDGDLFVDNSEDEVEQPDIKTKDNKVSEYSKKLISLLPPFINGEKENPAISTLRTFMKKQTFLKDAPVVGRKVIHRGDHISPLKQYEKPISLRDYIGSYDIELNKE